MNPSLKKQWKPIEWLDHESYGLVPENVPTGGDDYDIVWHVIEYHMAEPRERVIGTGRNAREAVEDAMKPKDDPTRWDKMFLSPTPTEEKL